MKKLLVSLFIIIGLCSCNHRTNKKIETKNVRQKNNFDWLLGSWTRLNDQENKTTFESWERKSEREYIGFSYTMIDKDTVWQENARLIKENEGWHLEITGEGESEATRFKLTKLETKKFVSENPNNTFPQKVEYSKKGKHLQAKILGEEMEIIFDFEKTRY
ncbi:MAG: hypothetical protein AAGF96_06400 [Bacteroidota bacterium]